MPPFVLEAVSSSRVRRDLEDKTELYRLLGAREYVIARLDIARPRLEGHRREALGGWSAWMPDGEGRLWSEVLGLGLMVRGGEVQAVTREGEVLRILPEETQARQQEALARARAEAARRQAEKETARLRAALERLTRGRDETADR